MKPLQLRKQLLIAESEINRAQLVRECQAMADDIHALATQARTIGIFASAAATLVAGVAGRMGAKPPVAKSSWFQKIASGARLASTVCLAFRSGGSTTGKEPS